jgi:hypothetical protein
MLKVHIVIGIVDVDLVNGTSARSADGAESVRLCEGVSFIGLRVQSRSCATTSLHSSNQSAVLGAFAGAKRNSLASRIKSVATSMS